MVAQIFNHLIRPSRNALPLMRRKTRSSSALYVPGKARRFGLFGWNDIGPNREQRAGTEQSVLRQLPVWLAHYNNLHPHRALGYRSPREFIVRLIKEALPGLQGATTDVASGNL